VNFDPVAGLCRITDIYLDLLKLLYSLNYKNSKHQITNPKQMPMTEIQNSKQADCPWTALKWLDCFGHWVFGFEFYLEFGY
jgi:hypothetical protein